MKNLPFAVEAPAINCVESLQLDEQLLSIAS